MTIFGSLIETTLLQAIYIRSTASSLNAVLNTESKLFQQEELLDLDVEHIAITSFTYIYPTNDCVANDHCLGKYVSDEDLIYC